MKISDFTQDNSAMLLIDHQVGTMKLIKNLPLSEVEKHDCTCKHHKSTQAARGFNQ
jgi:hypothetical protein